MEGLLQNATVYLKVLGKASTQQIQDWKQDDVKNAFKWTRYFQKAYLQLCKKPALLQKFDEELKSVARRQGYNFGQEVNSCFLGHSEDYLARTLLCNPHLPVELFQQLLSESEDLQEYCSKVIREKALMKSLNEMVTILQEGDQSKQHI